MARKRRAFGYQHNQLGVTFFQSGAIDLAVEQFALATRRAPWVSVFWLNYAIALLQKGDLEKADIALQRTLALDAQNQSAHYHLAQLLEKRGDARQALLALDKVVQLDPESSFGRRACERLSNWKPKILKVSEPRSAEKKQK